jgi:hypothetical protein
LAGVTVVDAVVAELGAFGEIVTASLELRATGQTLAFVTVVDAVVANLRRLDDAVAASSR